MEASFDVLPPLDFQLGDLDLTLLPTIEDASWAAFAMPVATGPSPPSSVHSSMHSSELSVSPHLALSSPDEDLLLAPAPVGGDDDDDDDEHDARAPFRSGKAVRRCKAATVEQFRASLTARELEMLEREHFALPDHTFALTRDEQKQLRVALRKVRNKISAQDSRVRKREYVADLEDRVKQCTVINIGLQQRVTELETENRSLLQQIQDLQRQLAAKMSGHTGTCLMLLGLCFAICFAPGSLGGAATTNATAPGFQARTLKSAEPAYTSWFAFGARGAEPADDLSSFQPVDLSAADDDASVSDSTADAASLEDTIDDLADVNATQPDTRDDDDARTRAFLERRVYL